VANRRNTTLATGKTIIIIVNSIGRENKVMLEKQIQAAILKHLKKTYPGAVVYKLTEETNCGIPDVLFIWAGRTIFFEVKRTGGSIKPLQTHVIKRINDNGGEAVIVYSVADVEKFIKSY